MIYLAGPIFGCEDAYCKIWRAEAKRLLEPHMCVVDPMDRDYRNVEDMHVNEIVTLDKADIRKCEWLLAYHTRPSVGTAMEVLFAWERDIRTVVVNASSFPCSPWLKYHANEVHPTLLAACNSVIAQL